MPGADVAQGRAWTVRSPGAAWRMLALAAVLGAGVALALGLALEVRREFASLRTAGLDNIQWTGSQLEVDMLRLMVATERARHAGQSDPGALAEVRTRFDILYSRASILGRGAIYDELGHDPDIVDGLAALRGFLDENLPLIDAGDAALLAGLPRLGADAAALHATVRQTVLRILDHFSMQSDRQRAGVAGLLGRAAVVNGVLLALLLALVLVLVRLSGRQQAAQAQLREARDAALAGQRAKASFVAVMSHEMRTPLNGIIASLEILRRRIADAGQAEFLALAHASALQLMNQINEVLDISKIEAGRLELARVPFALHAFLEETVAALRPLAGARGNRIALSVGADVPDAVAGDSFRLRQILQNFLSNAIKFTENGTITVTAACLPSGVDAPQPGLEFAVIDSGRGIAAEDLERIFEDFVMLDPGYSREVGGSGLGLSICRRLARAMGGEIGAESAPGQGSRFWVRLPLPAAPALPAPSAAAALPSPAPAPARPLCLLVVDDTAVNRTVLAQMLADEGHAAVLADSGHAAVEAACARRFDAILMDISMPEMDGVTAASRIREGGASADVPIFAMTAHAMPDELARFRAAGLRTNLLKPVRFEALRAALATVAPLPPPGQRADAEGMPAPAPPPAASPAPPQPPGSAPALPACVQEGTAPAAPALVDPATADEQRAAFGPEVLDEIRGQFAADADTLLGDLAAAAAEGDAPRLRRHAHELKGASATLGYLRLASVSAALEASAARGEAAGLSGEVAEAVQVWQATRRAVSGGGAGCGGGGGAPATRAARVLKGRAAPAGEAAAPGSRAVPAGWRRKVALRRACARCRARLRGDHRLPALRMALLRVAALRIAVLRVSKRRLPALLVFRARDHDARDHDARDHHARDRPRHGAPCATERPASEPRARAPRPSPVPCPPCSGTLRPGASHQSAGAAPRQGRHSPRGGRAPQPAPARHAAASGPSAWWRMPAVG